MGRLSSFKREIEFTIYKDLLGGGEEFLIKCNSKKLRTEW